MTEGGARPLDRFRGSGDGLPLAREQEKGVGARGRDSGGGCGKGEVSLLGCRRFFVAGPPQNGRLLVGGVTPILTFPH